MPLFSTEINAKYPFKTFPEYFKRLAHLIFHRLYRNAHLLGDLLVGQLFIAAQLEDRTALRR